MENEYNVGAGKGDAYLSTHTKMRIEMHFASWTQF